jgi:hypothetical protein
MKCEVKNMKAGHGIRADSFADSQHPLSSPPDRGEFKEAEERPSEVPKGFGAEDEREYHILPVTVRWML